MRNTYSNLMKIDVVQHMGQRLYSFDTSQPRTLGNAVALEYIGHGTLDSAIDRFVEKDVRIPERFIWNVFLCCKSEHRIQGLQDTS